MRKIIVSLVSVFTLLIGVSLLLYPTLSNWWNSKKQTRVIHDYSKAVENLSESEYEELIESAHRYNESLHSKPDRYEMNKEDKTEYMAQLNVKDNGAIGYVEIPKIGVTMPIYHTTDTDILQFAAGHIPGTSLPVGGKGTHCAISGHRGLPSAKLFTDIDKLKEGDLFYISVLKNRLAYKVDKILIEDPDNMEALEIDENEDYVTLVTCTPYGVNTHRLLVRGCRMELTEEEGAVYSTADAIQIDPIIVAPFVALPLVVVLSILITIDNKKRSLSVKARMIVRKENRP